MSNGRKRWQTADDILESVFELHRRFDNNEVSVEVVKAHAKVLTVAVRTVNLRLEFAKVSGTIGSGSDSLPDFKIARGTPDDTSD